jgi:hypothetical protein
MDEYFKNSLNLHKDINYIELIIRQKDSSINSMNWDKKHFDNLLIFLVEKNYTHFKKDYDIYRYQNLEYHIYDNNDKPMVYEYNLKDNYTENNLIYHAFIRYNIPIHMFPSTMNIHDKFSISRITIKVNNRIYLNFEIIKKTDNNYYRIYLNYNHSSNVDLNNNIDKIKEFIDLISSFIY